MIAFRFLFNIIATKIRPTIPPTTVGIPAILYGSSCSHPNIDDVMIVNIVMRSVSTVMKLLILSNAAMQEEDAKLANMMKRVIAMLHPVLLVVLMTQTVHSAMSV